MRKLAIILPLMILCSTHPVPAYCEDGVVFTLNRWMDVKQGEKITFYRKDLADQMMEIQKTAPTEAINMEISLDGGETWSDMIQRSGSYLYRYIPQTEETMRIVFSWTNTNGLTATLDTKTTLTYISE
jgi:hypothetical protein